MAARTTVRAATATTCPDRVGHRQPLCREPGDSAFTLAQVRGR